MDNHARKFAGPLNNAAPAGRERVRGKSWKICRSCDAIKKPLRGSDRNGFEYVNRSCDLVNGKLPESDELLAGSDQGAKSFGQKFGIERLLERFVDRGTIEAHRAAVVGQQGDQDRFREIGILTQGLADL